MTVASCLAGAARATLLLAAVATMTAVQAADEGPATRALALPESELRSSLRMIAEEYDVNVLFADGLVEGKKAPPIEGMFTAGEAVNAMLEGSGLYYEPDENGDFVILPARDTSTPSGDADSARARGPVALEEIVVTGTKITRSLQDTVASVAVWDEEIIDSQNFITLGDILNQTANVSTANNDSIITIRGLRNEGAGSFENTSDVSTVYVDGVFLPSALFASGALNLWDIDSAEVFRGPQSTIQGRNALVGAVVLNTKDPGDEFSADAQVQVADYDSLRWSAAATLPVTDTLGFRLAADETSSDGFITNPTLGTNAADRSEATTLRAKARWQPTDELNVKLNYTHVDSFKGDGRIVANRFPAERVTLENIQSRSDIEADIASLNITYAMNDRWALSSVTAYTESEFRLFLDTTNDETGGDSVLDSAGSDEIWSQELRASFQSERIRGVLGAYIYNQTGVTESLSRTFVTTDAVLPDPATFASIFFGTESPTPEQVDVGASIRGRVVNTLPTFPLIFDRAGDLTIENYAAFGEFDMDLSDRWSATLGLRYDSESVDQNLSDANIIPPIETGDGLVDAVASLLISQFSEVLAIENVDNEYDVLLPKAVLTYAWKEDVSTSVSYQRGYRAGGLSTNLFRAALAPPGSSQVDLETLGIVNRYGAEFTNNYELALRSRLLDGRLQLNSNVYLIDYQDQQIRLQLSQNPLDAITANVGESRMYGFEFDSAFSVNERLFLGVNLGLSSTEFTDGVGVLEEVIGGGLDLTGLEFSFAPRWTGGAFARYAWDSGWYVNGRVRYTDESFSTPENDPATVNDSYTVCDFIAGYGADRWRAEVFVNNAFDEDYLTLNNGPDDAASSVAGAPRFFGGRLVVHL